MGPNLHGVIMAMVRVRMMMMRMIMMMMMMMVMMMMMMTKEFSESPAQASGPDLVFKVAGHSATLHIIFIFSLPSSEPYGGILSGWSVIPHLCHF